jgi:periplasmic divalent cation tolerance protein
MQPVLIYITASNREEAISIARDLLGKKLIACANIVDHAASLYWWDGEIEQNNEALIIAKTMSSHVEKAVMLVKSIHSYDCPAILTVPVTGGNHEYMEWMGKQLTLENA